MRVVLVVAGLTAAVAAGAATPAKPKANETTSNTAIYSCVDAQGHRLSSDRPIPECVSQDQRLLNRDGTLKAVVPPAQSPEEKARVDAAKRQAEQIRLAREAEARRDRALLSRYPDQETHDEARARAQEPVNHQIDVARKRLAELDTETQALARERETLGHKPLPPALRARVAANEGAIDAQRSILRDQLAESDRLNMQFDAELARLRALWAGATPGRMGPIVVPSAPARSASPP
jgi:hypothetical protein